MGTTAVTGAPSTLGRAWSASVRQAVRGDMTAVARIHKSRFSGDDYLLGQYSVSLISAFYASFVDRCVFLVHTSNNEVDGFILGAPPDTLSDCKRAFLRANFLRCGLESAFRPRFWRAAFRAMRGLLFSRGKAGRFCLPARESHPDACNMRLLSLAISERAGRSGASTALFQGVEARIRDRHRAYELTILKSNTPIVQYYELLGFRRVGETTEEFVYRRDLRPSN